MKPSRQDIKDNLVSYIEELGGKVNTQAAYSGLAKKMQISREVLSEQRGNEPWWNNEVRWARRALVDEGYLKKPSESGKGIWELTIKTKFFSTFIPEELPKYSAGHSTRIEVNKYERDKKAREACISYYGYDCVVCGFNFEQTYGSLGESYIHVHHLIPVSTLRGRYELDPIHDLRPVCPNCHAMLHREDPPITIQQLRARILK